MPSVSTAVTTAAAAGKGPGSSSSSTVQARPYAIFHYANASIEEEDWERLEAWMTERGVELTFADTVFCVDVCQVPKIGQFDAVVLTNAPPPPTTHTHAPCDMLCLVPVLIGC